MAAAAIAVIAAVGFVIFKQNQKAWYSYWLFTHQYLYLILQILLDW